MPSPKPQALASRLLPPNLWAFHFVEPSSGERDSRRTSGVHRRFVPGTCSTLRLNTGQSLRVRSRNRHAEPPPVRGESVRPTAVNFRMRKASPFFRRLTLPGTTRQQQHGPRVPSREHRPASSSSPPDADPGCLLERHSQGAAFQLLGHHAERRGPARPPHTLPALVMTFGHRVTWLADVSPAHVRLMSGLPARHSFRVRRLDFREPKLEAFPYPQTKVLSPSRIALQRPATCSASSLDALTGKPLSFGPFALELFAAGDLPRTPGSMKTRSRSSPSRELHAPATLNAHRRDEPRGRD